MTGCLSVIAAGGRPLAAEASPTTVNGTANSSTPNGAAAATTGSTTVTATGGAGGYAYAWTHVSGVNATINSPSSATTSFTRTGAVGVSGDEIRTYVGTFRCTVTSGGLTTTVDVTVSTTHNYIGA